MDNERQFIVDKANSEDSVHTNEGTEVVALSEKLQSENSTMIEAETENVVLPKEIYYIPKIIKRGRPNVSRPSIKVPEVHSSGNKISISAMNNYHSLKDLESVSLANSNIATSIIPNAVINNVSPYGYNLHQADPSMQAITPPNYSTSVESYPVDNNPSPYDMPMAPLQEAYSNPNDIYMNFLEKRQKIQQPRQNLRNYLFNYYYNTPNN